jgi:tetratricopeptide (TPR) repeat protein
MDAKDYLKRGIDYSKNGNTDSALEDFSEAIRLLSAPIKHFPYYLRGKVYYLKNEFDLAIADFDEAIRICGDDAKYYLWRGIAYGKKENNDRALADFDEAVRLDAKDAEIYYNRGTMYSRKGDGGRAAADFTEAIRLDPNMAIAYNNRGREYIAKDDYDNAIADFETALKLEPDNKSYRKNLAMAKDDKAKAGSGGGKSKDSGSEKTTEDLARTYIGKEHITEGFKYLEIKFDYDKAIAEFTEGLRFLPDDAQAYIGRGLAFLKKGETARAIADYEKSVEIEPDDNNLPELFRGPRRSLAKLKKGGSSGSIIRWIIFAAVVLGIVTCVTQCW